MTTYFTPEELSCHCGRGDECDAVEVDRVALIKLIALREDFGEPMPLNSSVRCKFHNQKVGGAENSQHLDGIAFDVQCKDGIYMRRLVLMALARGWSVGVKRRMLHLDMRPGLPIVFGYA